MTSPVKTGLYTSQIQQILGLFPTDSSITTTDQNQEIITRVTSLAEQIETNVAASKICQKEVELLAKLRESLASNHYDSTLQEKIGCFTRAFFISENRFHLSVEEMNRQKIKRINNSKRPMTDTIAMEELFPFLTEYGRDICYLHLEKFTPFEVTLTNEVIKVDLKKLLDLCPNLTHLILIECMKFGEAATLAPSIALMDNLKEINLTKNRMWGDDFVALAPSFANRAQLRSLNLSHNNLEIDGIQALVTPLTGMVQLEILDLSSCDMQSRGITLLAPSLATILQLRSLNLSHNNMGKEGVIALTPALANKQVLESLDLGINQLFDAAVELNLLLLGVPQLSSLILNINLLKIAGVRALAPSLRRMQQLKLLDLSSNDIIIYDVQKWANAAAEKLSLSSESAPLLMQMLMGANLDGIPSESTLVELFEMLIDKEQLELLKLKGNQISEPIQATLKTQLSHTEIEF
jgi:Ran GTPase-activating protein (RanGAP) involved in mRNA processing and transport